MTRLRIDLTYENGESFEMTAKEDSGDEISIIKIEENGRISDLWVHIAKICQTYFTSEVDIIGDIMKAS